MTSALKPGPDGSVILRVHEARGRATAGVKIKLNAKITYAHESNLIEDSGRKLRVENDSVQFDLGPYEIKTIKFQLHPLESEK